MATPCFAAPKLGPLIMDGADVIVVVYKERKSIVKIIKVILLKVENSFASFF